MGKYVFGLFKGTVGFFAGSALKPDSVIELILSLAEIIAKRTDTKVDDEVVAELRKLLTKKD